MTANRFFASAGRELRSLVAAAMVLLVGAALAVTHAAPASAATVSDVVPSLMNQAHNLCLDAAAQTDGTNGGKVQLWRCLGGANQQWQFLALGASSANGEWGELVNQAYGLCLDAAAQQDGNSGDPVQLWRCTGQPNQLWWEGTDSSPTPGAVTDAALENEAAFNTYGGDLCLDAAAQTDGSNGGKVQLWTCQSSSTAHNQMWSSSMELANSAHDLCLDAAAQTDGSNGGKVQLWTCKGNVNQQWVLEVAGGRDWLVNLAHGLCLDAAAQTNGSNGGRVQIWTCIYGDANQRWAPQRPSGVAYPQETFQNGAHGLSLDAAAQTDGSNGGTVQVWWLPTPNVTDEWTPAYYPFG